MTATDENPTLEHCHSPPPRKWKLRFFSGENECTGSLSLGDSLILGSGRKADLCLNEPTVSSAHCKVTATPRGLQVVDLGSKNGLMVGAGRVEKVLLGASRARFFLGKAIVEMYAADERASESTLGLVGMSPAICEVRKLIRRFAPLSAPVLITGESGSGKDVVARAIHTESQRKGKYRPLNVAALPEGLLDSELFGHERGAFTGASGRHRGQFEEAAGGTLFLDEIADMSLLGQAKLLRVVEDGRVRTVGAEAERYFDVRLVSATCAPLRERIESGEFRHDLFHRLSRLVIKLPPLRERRDDILLLADDYLEKMVAEFGSKHLLPASRNALVSAPWRGNVRELFSVLYRACALSTGDELGVGHLDVEVSALRDRAPLLAEHALKLLDVHGTVSAAARAAGVPRTTFRSVLERRQLRLHKQAQ